ncbi:MAG: winged helix-turn-helix domain-containing protein [Pseudomonadota bacterium]
MLDIDRGALLSNDNEIKVRPKSFEVLKYLVEQAGKLVSRQELLDAAWKDAVVTDDAVTQCLIDIRRALDDSAQKIVRTVPRRGYIFEAEVAPLKKEMTDASAKPSGLRRRVVWIAIPAVAVVLGLLFTLTKTPPENTGSSASARVAESPAIAVMPLVNMSSHEENVFFAGGIHEEVLTNLSRIEDIQVISRTATLRYAASGMTLREISNELAVDYIVEGSVRRIDNHVRVTIQLINANNDFHVWANNYERELVDVFATQSALAREISDSIHLELQPESVRTLEGMPTTSVKAYDLYVRAANVEKTEGETEESMIRRRKMLEEAVAEDPDFVEAWAVLKRVYDLQLDRLGSRGWYLEEGEDRDRAAADFRARSQRALNKAIALDPDNVETLLSRVVDHDWPKTPEEMQAQKAIFDQIIATFPEHAKTWYHLGWWHTHRADFPEQDVEVVTANAAAAFEEALRLDPFNARMVAATLGWYRNRGYQEDVTRLAERFNQIIPETADDRKLARVSWVFKRNQIVSAFLATADESLIEKFENGWQEAVDSSDFFLVPIARLIDEAELGIFADDQDRLIELSRLSIDANESQYHFIVFITLKSIGMSVLTDQGNLDQARLVARSVLEQEEAILVQGVQPCNCVTGSLAQTQNKLGLATLAQAHAVLGDLDEARRLNEKLFQEADLNPVGRIRTLAFIDVDRAVENAFAERAKNPGWDGFDAIAAHYVFNGRFLAHPRVQAYYLNEGKWIDYLAARVPEYAKYAEATE